LRPKACAAINYREQLLSQQDNRQRFPLHVNDDAKSGSELHCQEKELQQGIERR
jgi:hypothetical protein